MSRRKGSRNRVVQEALDKIAAQSVVEGPSLPSAPPADDAFIPKKSLFTVYEAAQYFSVTERTIYLWVEHGHLQGEKIVGLVRIPRESILNCRFNTHQPETEST